MGRRRSATTVDCPNGCSGVGWHHSGSDAHAACLAKTSLRGRDGRVDTALFSAPGIDGPPSYEERGDDGEVIERQWEDRPDGVVLERYHDGDLRERRWVEGAHPTGAIIEGYSQGPVTLRVWPAGEGPERVTSERYNAGAAIERRWAPGDGPNGLLRELHDWGWTPDDPPRIRPTVRRWFGEGARADGVTYEATMQGYGTIASE